MQGNANKSEWRNNVAKRPPEQQKGKAKSNARGGRN